MSALVLVFPDEDGVYDVLTFPWLPGETLDEREDEDRAPYKLWAKQGHLLTFAGKTSDPAAIALKVAELHGLYNIQTLAFDPWRIEDFQRELSGIGCAVPLIGVAQSFKDMAPAVDFVERVVLEKRLRHGAHPLLNMAAGNARVELHASGNRKLSKRKSNGRIDPLVALTLALGIASRHEVAPAWTPLLEVV